MGDQSSYLSRISQFIFVEKKLSCGEFWSFYKEFEQFMEFYQSLCRFCAKSMWRKICVEKISVETKLTYNCAHLRSTKETLTIEYFRIILEKKIRVKIFWPKICFG